MQTILAPREASAAGNSWAGENDLTFHYVSGEGRDGYQEKFAQNTVYAAKRSKKDSSTPAPDARYLLPLNLALLTHHEAFERWKNTRALAAYAKGESGYLYHLIRDRELFLDAVAASQPPSNMWFTIVEPDRPMYFYLDAEEDRGLPGKPDCDETQFFVRCSAGLTFIQASFDSIYGIDTSNLCERNDWFSACTEGKNSFHGHTKWGFECLEWCHLAMMRSLEMLNTLRRLFPRHPIVTLLLSSAPPRFDERTKNQLNNPWIIDWTVYTRNRNFRMAGQTKTPKKNNPLLSYDPVSGTKHLLEESTTEERRKWARRTQIVLPTRNAGKRYLLPSPETAEKIFGRIGSLLDPKGCTSVREALKTICCQYVWIGYYDGNQDDELRDSLGNAIDSWFASGGKFERLTPEWAWHAARWFLWTTGAVSTRHRPLTVHALEAALADAALCQTPIDAFHVWMHRLGIAAWKLGDPSELLPPKIASNPNKMAEFAIMHARLCFLFSAPELFTERTVKPINIQQSLHLFDASRLGDLEKTWREEEGAGEEEQHSVDEPDQGWYEPLRRHWIHEKSLYLKPEWRRTAVDWFNGEEEQEKREEPTPKMIEIVSTTTAPPDSTESRAYRGIKVSFRVENKEHHQQESTTTTKRTYLRIYSTLPKLGLPIKRLRLLPATANPIEER